MEQKRVDEVEEQIALALENIERLDKEALSFAEGKAELVRTSKDFRNLLEKLDILFKDVSMLVDKVSTVTVDETLKRFDENVSKIEQIINSFNESNLRMISMLNENLSKIEQTINSLSESNSKLIASTNEMIDNLKRNSNRNFIIYGSMTIIVFIASIISSILFWWAFNIARIYLSFYEMLQLRR